MKKQRISHKTREERERIEALLKDKEINVLPYTPDLCISDCIFRQKGFCMEKMAPAPKHGEPCYINRERG